MRRVLLLATAIGLLVTAPAVALSTLPSVFGHQIHIIKGRTHHPAILLPRSMPLDAKHLYPSGGPDKSGYDLELGAAPHCGGANACFVAAFTAVTGGKVFGSKVKVSGVSRAGFHPLSCGASCSPPEIDFLVHGTLYTIQANLKTKQSDKAALIAAAQSAISAGPR
jgi:hypothetical protein